MARYCGEKKPEPILRAAEFWRDRGLLDDSSVFTERPLWTVEGLEALDRYFVQNLDYGEGKFWEKLQGQLASAGSAAQQLAAEMTWLMLLCPSNISAETKQQQIADVWGWSGEALPGSAGPWVTREVLAGIGSAGPGYNNHRWRELAYCITFCLAFKKLPLPERQHLLGDPWKFAKWLESLPDSATRQFRHMVLFLLFPDDFERIFGSTDRKQVVLKLGGERAEIVNSRHPLELDMALREIRKALEVKYQRKDLDYYVEPLSALWQSATEEFKTATHDITREHVYQALGEIDRDGIPEGAESITYDLIYGARRYPPKLVLSIASKYATGEELDRASFKGGEESPAFHVLNKLGFHIEKKEFVGELLKRFLAQADEGQQLAPHGYPSSYRGLTVRVSFGKGNFALVPWISFVGFGQVTQQGIYPVFLYYKAQKILILAYGVSATNIPSVSWKLTTDVQAINEYFRIHFKQRPPRYGESFVYTTYRVPDEIDPAAITRDLDALIEVYETLFREEGQHSETSRLSSMGVAEPLPSFEDFSDDQALDDLFIQPEEFRRLLSILRSKKNLILQGPPGVGKTFFAKRLGYALMGEKASQRLGMVQFHPSYAYEDFIQGYRPSGTGFSLKDGVFYRFCKRAIEDPSHDYVFIIDEINRGNLSKVFGELMMLIEQDKRGPDWAISLTYSSGEDKFHVPENLFFIGLMNTADRSLAMVDYALRRRFAFVDLKPGFELPQFREFLEKNGASDILVNRITSKMGRINEKIAHDTNNLGPGYCIGHSYFCNFPKGTALDETWYQQVVATEIIPLLREYWFDDATQAESLAADLLLMS